MEGKNGRRRGPAHLSARGMVLLLLIAVVVALACGPAADGAQAAVKRCKGAAKPLKVAVYVGGGTNSDKVCATMRALQACGFDFAGVQRDDIVQGRLVRDSYDVLLLPAGQDDSKVVYDVYWGLGGDPIARDNIRSFVSGGGGVVGLESGAAYMCQDGALQLYSGLYTRTGEAGKTWLGGRMIVALIACVIALAFTGWLYTTDMFWGSEAVEDVHRTLAWALLGLVMLHLAGVIFTSVRHRENLIKAMIDGRKDAPREQ